MVKKIIIITGVVLILSLTGYYFIKNGEEKDTFAEAVKGDIVKEVFETGVLKKGEELDLGFKAGGKIGKIHIKTGDYVKEGELLGELEKDDLMIQLEKAKEGFEAAKMTLKKTEEGLTKEEIDVYRVAVSNAEKSFSNSANSLDDARNSLTARVEDAYSDSDSAVRGKIDRFFTNPRNAFAKFEVSISDGYGHYSFPIDSDLSAEINRKRIETEETLESLKSVSEEENPVDYVEDVEDYLKEIISFLDKVALAVNSFSTDNYTYQSTIAQYKTDVSSARSSVALALTNLLSSKSSFTTAKSSYDSAKGTLDKAESELNSVLKEAREEDVGLQRAKLKQAEAEVNLIEEKIKDTAIRAFRDGIITDVKKKEGEIIQQGEELFSFLGENSYHVEVDIYEGEIARIDIGDEAIIEFVAFPYQKFNGKVISIEPGSKVIDGVVYYRALLDIDILPDKAMTGMTADIVITTIEKENVLTIPESAISRRDGKVFAEVLEGNKLKEKKIKVGARGDGRVIEVISGLKEGEKVLVK